MPSSTPPTDRAGSCGSCDSSCLTQSATYPSSAIDCCLKRRTHDGCNTEDTLLTR
ncbi:hypothetical protein IQ06DRAFT_291427 [Phaeosphaeriaceae sp. SRC1lsM3a]|nr:hypothetical protein IQ06DRAFT_291427 [Stagonospora sp. SRC1lsM3a]